MNNHITINGEIEKYLSALGEVILLKLTSGFKLFAVFQALIRELSAAADRRRGEDQFQNILTGF